VDEREFVEHAESRENEFRGVLILVGGVLCLAGIVFLGLLLWGKYRASHEYATVQAEESVGIELSPDAIDAIADQFDIAAVKNHMEFFANIPSRLTGTPGCDSAADYVEDFFRNEVELEDVVRETYTLAVPITRKPATLTLADTGRVLPLHPMWPNLVVPSATPEAGVTGRLVYGGKGFLHEFGGVPVKNSIVLLDYNCSFNWLNAAMLGAKAIIFVEPSITMPKETASKWVTVPLNLPRFMVRREAGLELVERLRNQRNEAVSATVRSDVRWEKRDGANFMGFVPGTDPALKKRVMVFQAYYDSMSVTPDIAPGAQNSCGIATLLELARYFKSHPPKRTVMFLACSGHFEGLQGMKHWTEDHFEDYSGSDKKWDIRGLFSIDTTTRASALGIYYMGWFFELPESRQQRFSDFATYARSRAGTIGDVLGKKKLEFVDGVNSGFAQSWRPTMAGLVAFDSEVFSMPGGMGMSFSTPWDARPLVGSPLDTLDRLTEENYTNLENQGRVLFPLLTYMCNENEDSLPLPPEGQRIEYYRCKKNRGISVLQGQVFEWQIAKSILPDTPVAGSLVVVKGRVKDFMAVKGNVIDVADDEARFRFVGTPPNVAYQNLGDVKISRKTRLEAYKLDPLTNNVVYAPNRSGAGGYEAKVKIEVTTENQVSNVLAFKCRGTSFYDFIDPQNLRILGTTSGRATVKAYDYLIDVFDARTDSIPEQYGYSLPQGQTLDLFSHGSEPIGRPWAPPMGWVGMVYMPPEARFKLVLRNGPVRKRFLLTGADDQTRTGHGIEAGTQVLLTPLRVANDVHLINKERLEELEKHRITTPGLTEINKSADREIEKLRNLPAEDYRNRLVAARRAWAFDMRIYPDVRNTQQDLVKGVVYYLFLLLPFAVFTEKLMFAFPTLVKRLVCSLLIFGAVFLVLQFVHPAFDIALNPTIIVLAFILLALSSLVLVLVFSRFEQQIKEVQDTSTTIHQEDVGRFSSLGAAFSLGVSNLRRRKVRTFLTCVTLMLVLFCVLSFTSIVTGIKASTLATDISVTHNGVMIRDPYWGGLDPSAYRWLIDEFGDEHVVCPRSYARAPQEFGQGERGFPFTCKKKPGHIWEVRGVTGFTVQEKDFTGVDKTITTGRWFEPDDLQVCIIPPTVAKEFNIMPDDVGKVDLEAYGMKFRVIGLYDAEAYGKILGLDGEELTPVDQELQGQLQGQGNVEPVKGFRKYVHLDPEMNILMPYFTSLNLSGGLASIGIRTKNEEQTKSLLKDLMNRLDTNVYAKINNKSVRYSSLAKTSVTGLGDLLIPVLIGGLIVLNTMLGAVYERVKEIGIYSALGLAPTHIGMLFVAEAFVFVVLGSVAGYLIGQGVSKAMDFFGIFKGLTLNYSSLATVLCTLVVSAVVLLSTIYPARKAATVASPSLSTRISLPEPDGDVLTVGLPFSVTGIQAVGMRNFLSEFIRGYTEFAVGGFIAEDLRTGTLDTPNGTAYTVAAKVLLAPFDLGVAQRVNATIRPTEVGDVYSIVARLERLTGSVSAWTRLNRFFVNTIRKQLLLWRGLKPEVRDEYSRRTAEEAATTEV